MKDLQFNFETLSVETFKDTADTIPEKHASFKKDTEVQTKYLSETKKIMKWSRRRNRQRMKRETKERNH